MGQVITETHQQTVGDAFGLDRMSLQPAAVQFEHDRLLGNYIIIKNDK